MAKKKEAEVVDQSWEIKDRTYLTTGNQKPLTLKIPSKHSARHPLLHYDDKKNEQRELRYATNQNSPFKDEYVKKALCKYAEIVKNVGYGQILDITSEKKRSITEDEIMMIHKLKTASYTIEGPLQIGAMLAGANEEDLQIMSNYGTPLGLAFQMQDDILGLFGSEEKIGKPVGSDIREGKKTLLIFHALGKCGEKEKGIITRALGNEHVTMDEIDIIRDIVREIGSLDYSKKLVSENTEKAIQVIEGSNFRDEAKEFLVEIADFIGSREY